MIVKAQQGVMICVQKLQSNVLLSFSTEKHGWSCLPDDADGPSG